MTAFSSFFSSGHAVDFVLIVMVAEFGFLSFRRRKIYQAPKLLDRALAFAPGAFLLLALRAALTGAGWVWIALLLAASFPLHIADLIRRRL